MKLIHTADWHLGVRLYNESREHEQRQFLAWMAATLAEEAPDVLIIAGDIFDTTTPPNSAQEMYYQFLVEATKSCREIVVIGGNHDSPSFLDAPEGLLRSLHVHVIGAMRENISDEIIPITDANGELQAIIAAVPYLRERDIRRVVQNEDLSDKENAVVAGIMAHYQAIAKEAETLRAGRNIPIIATGHLFVAGGKTLEHDGVRDLYVGNLSNVGRDCFPETFDYVALGHLHVPQIVAGCETIRYSGTPIPMGFSEVGQKKQILRVSFQGREPTIASLPVPSWQALQKLSGNKAEVKQQVAALIAAQKNVWLELDIHPEGDYETTLAAQLQAMRENTPVKILRIHYPQPNAVLTQQESPVALEYLSPEKVFALRLGKTELSEEDQQLASEAFREILRDIHEA